MTAVLPTFSLEGPRAAAQKRPHIGHVSLEGPRAPIRAALEKAAMLEGPTHDLIKRAGISPALISRKTRRR